MHHTFLKKTPPLPHPSLYCAFHKHANSKVQKPFSQLRFFTAVNHNYDHKQRTSKHKTDRNPPIANHRPWPIERVDVQFCFLRLRSVKMIDGSEKRNHQLAFELQSSHVWSSKASWWLRFTRISAAALINFFRHKCGAYYHRNTD